MATIRTTSHSFGDLFVSSTGIASDDRWVTWPTPESTSVTPLPDTNTLPGWDPNKVSDTHYHFNSNIVDTDKQAFSFCVSLLFDLLEGKHGDVSDDARAAIIAVLRECVK